MTPIVCALAHFHAPVRPHGSAESQSAFQNCFSHAHFRKIKPERTRQVFTESKLAVMGMATKNG
ncbi:MAG: hypothetical protein Q8N81_06485, partial [bacterium]|nr:hypothetical protein [bacterium]